MYRGEHQRRNGLLTLAGMVAAFFAGRALVNRFKQRQAGQQYAFQSQQSMTGVPVTGMPEGDYPQSNMPFASEGPGEQQPRMPDV